MVGALTMLGFALVAITALTVSRGIQTVPTAQLAVVMRFGKMARVAREGAVWLWPWERIGELVSLRAIPRQFQIVAKTSDGVDVAMQVTVAVRVKADRVKEFLASSHNATERIHKWTEFGVREAVDMLKLSEVYGAGERICEAIEPALRRQMARHGEELGELEMGAILAVDDARFKRVQMLKPERALIPQLEPQRTAA